MSRSMIAAMQQGLEDLRMQKSARAVVLAGAGASFCAGLDLAEMFASVGAPDAYQRWAEDAAAYRDLLEAMLRFPKPLIAAVDGEALGAGFGLVLACDMVVSSRRSTFGLPEPRRGLAAGVTAPLLAFRLGGSQAAHLLLSAQTIEAERAYQLGVAHYVVDSEQTWARATQLGEKCAESAAESLQMSKRLLNETIAEHLQVAFSAGAAISSMARTTEAAAEGLKAFAEKRTPNFP